MIFPVFSVYPWGMSSVSVKISNFHWNKPFKELNWNESMKDENGQNNVGTHLIIVDDSNCFGKTSETLSNPSILNYYRQFLIKGFDDSDTHKNLLG